MRLGITGHQTIPKQAFDFVSEGLKQEVKRALSPGPLWGITSLAQGSDQLFAGLVLRAGGQLHVIIPCDSYETTFEKPALKHYKHLLSRAAEVEVLPYDKPSEGAFYAAGKRMVDLSDVVIAIWDGRPARGLGGTADIVKYASSHSKALRVVWPVGIPREGD